MVGQAAKLHELERWAGASGGLLIVEMPELALGPEHDQAVVSIHIIKVAVVEEEVEEAEDVEGEAAEGAEDASAEDTPAGDSDGESTEG